MYNIEKIGFKKTEAISPLIWKKNEKLVHNILLYNYHEGNPLDSWSEFT